MSQNPETLARIALNPDGTIPAGDISSIGTVTSVGVLADTGAILVVTGSPVTTSGSIQLQFHTQTANKILASATSGGAAVPAFRALVAADIPDVSATYQAKSAINTFGGYSQLVAAPSTASSAGAAGQISYDSGFIYVCVATNTWVRAALATF